MTTNSFRNVKLLGWFNFCMDFRIYLAIAVIYFAQVTGSYALALGIFSISTISSALFEIPTGVFSDLIGRRKTIIYGQIAAIISIVIYAFGGSFVFLAIGAVLEGLAGSLFSGNNSALLYDTLKENGQEDKYAEFEGKNSSMFQFALGISALIGSLVLSFETFRYLFYLSIIPQVAGLLIAFKIVEPTKHFKKVETNTFAHLGEAFARLKANPKLQKLSLIEILDYGFGQSIKHLFLAFTGSVWAVWLVPFVKFFQHLLVALGLRISVKVTKIFNEIKTAQLSYFGVALTSTLTAILSPLFMLLAGWFWGIWWVAHSNMSQKEFTDNERATLGSITSFGRSIAFGIFSIVFGMLADKYSPMLALTLASIGSLSIPLFYLRMK